MTAFGRVSNIDKKPTNRVARQHGIAHIEHMTNTISHRYTMKVRSGAGVWILSATEGHWRKLVAKSPAVDAHLAGAKTCTLEYVVVADKSGRFHLPGNTFDLTVAGRKLTIAEGK